MKAVCHTCMHHCSLEPGQRGLCRARKNEYGNIICENYGKVTSLALDAIEKKTLKLFYPGSRILSVGSYGCNLRCAFCQNHSISMADAEAAETVFISPEALVEKALACKNAGNIGVAYTYNEPLVGWEYIRDTGVLVKKAGMKNVLVMGRRQQWKKYTALQRRPENIYNMCLWETAEPLTVCQQICCSTSLVTMVFRCDMIIYSRWFKV